MENYMNKMLIAALALLATPVVAQTKPVVEIVTSIPISGSGGQIGFNITTILNTVQSEREYRFSAVPGAQGDTAALRVLTLTNAGQSAVLFNGITTFTSNRLSKTTEKDVFDRDNDFMLSYGIGKNALAVLVNPESDIKTVDDLVNKIRSKEITYSASTLTAPAALMMNDIFTNHFKIKDKVKQINYKSPSEIVLAMMNKEVDYTVFMVPDMTNLKALMVSSDQRLETFPTAPTGKELGINDFNLSTILVYAIPKNEDKLAKIFEGDMKKACAAPEFDKVAKLRAPYLSLCMTPKDTIATVDNENKTINRMYTK
jgi:tripartite-type tricarboxylate transporter receptor subunit TctC